jgi:hypothetical protein
MPEQVKATQRPNCMRWLLVGVAGLVILIVAIGIVAVTVVDEAAVRSRFQSTAAEVFGIDVDIEGPVALGIWPAPHVAAEQVRADKGDARVARIEAIRMDLAIAPLFVGKLHIRQLRLAGADIHIRRDASGRFGFQGLVPNLGRGGRLPDAEFSGVALSYVDEAAGTHTEASGCRGRFPTMAVARDGGPRDLARLELSGELRCDTLRHQDFDLSDVTVEVRAHQGRVTLDPLVLRLFGGEGSGRLEANLSAELPNASLDFVLENFELEAFLRAMQPEASAEGRLSFTASVSAAGVGRQAMERGLEGEMALHGEALVMHGVDLDKRLADYESTQRFGLVDAGAVLFAGPFGLVVTKGGDFTRLLLADKGTTEFRQVVSRWKLRQGVAHAEDVAAATRKNRIAALGKVDLAARRFDGLSIVLLDKRGCAVMEQAITGSFNDPQVEEPSAIETLLGPLIDLVRKGIDQFSTGKCEVIYDGTVGAP